MVWVHIIFLFSFGTTNNYQKVQRDDWNKNETDKPDKKKLIVKVYINSNLPSHTEDQQASCKGAVER